MRLSVVATPIGNLEDISARALRALREADMVLCEDTRVTKKLLAHYGIGTPTLSFHAHSGGAKYAKILGLLEEGKHLALVTDAGTPGVSDPGASLVQAVRAALPKVRIEAIPGPSALTAAFSIAGIPDTEFTFYGFLPHKKGRETLLREIANAGRLSVFFESPHRIAKALESLAVLAPTKRVTVVREISKIFEEVLTGTASEVLAMLYGNPKRTKGEFVVFVEGE